MNSISAALRSGTRHTEGHEMVHRQQVQTYVEYMKKRGVRPLNAAPPLCRALWAMGWRGLPPPYWPRWIFLTWIALAFAFAWFVVLLLTLILVNWVFPVVGIPWGLVVCLSSVGGIGSGNSMGRYYEKLAREVTLPPWSDFSGGQDMVL